MYHSSSTRSRHGEAVPQSIEWIEVSPNSFRLIALGREMTRGSFSHLMLELLEFAKMAGSL